MARDPQKALERVLTSISIVNIEKDKAFHSWRHNRRQLGHEHEATRDAFRKWQSLSRRVEQLWERVDKLEAKIV